MFSRGKLICRFRFFGKVLCRCESTEPSKGTYSPLFFDEKVQELLKKMTNIDIEKVFAPRPSGKELKPSIFKFMTTKQLEEEMEKCRKRADYLMQIPPLVNIREDDVKTLSQDSIIEGHDIHHSKIVFVDISPDVLNEQRQILVREPNGDLRTASRFERHRMNQIYSPISGRQLEMPKMFEDEFLKGVLDREDYLFILDRACVQFEPDDAMYHKVISLTYDTINQRGHFERLHSTRHFGSFAFYLVTHRRIDDLLLDNIKSERIADAHSLVELYHIIHPNCESAKNKSKNKIETLREYIKLDSYKKAELELTLQDYLNKVEERKETRIGIKKAHGI